MVWLIYPEKQLVEVLTPNSRNFVSMGEVLEGGDLLPNFKLALSKLFAK